MSGDRLRWFVAVAAAVIVMGVLFPLFRGPRPVAVVSGAARRSVELAKLGTEPNNAFAESTALADPTPLFLPTEWNASRKEIAQPQPGDSFERYQPKLTFAETDLQRDQLQLGVPIALPETPAVALVRPAVAQAELGMGRVDAPIVALTERGACLAVGRTDGQPLDSSPERSLVLKRELAEAMALARPPGTAAWQPFELLAAVDAAGLVGPLVLATRSGVEEVDGYFQRYLAQTLRIGERLAPGFYRISVGP